MRNKMSVQMPTYLSAKFGAFDVLSFEGYEELSRPYELDIQFNSAEARLDLADLLGKPLTFGLHETVEATLLGGDLPEAARRVWHGVVRRASSLKHNENNHLYSITLAPKISLLADFTTSRLFQNQSVPEIVGALLRKHGFTGSDFVFKLTREYQAFEYVTQFCENDLEFIQRLLAQEGIYFAFEQGKNSEQLIFADNLEGYVRENLKFVAFRANSGLESAAQESVHALDIAHLTMLKKTQLKNYNYRDSNAPLLVEYGFNGDTKATNGVNFQWGDSDFRTQQQGQLLAKIRQERSIAAQCYANGRGDVMLTRPGEVLRLNGFSAIEAPHGWLVVKVGHKASRQDSYVNDFEVIPGDRV